MKMYISKQTVYRAFLAVSIVMAGVWYMKRIQNTVTLPRLAKIDSTRIKNEAQPFVRVRQWFEKQCQHTQNDLTTRVHELQKTYEWLKVATKDQKARERHDDFRREVAALERVVQERKENLTQQFGSISTFLENKLKQVIAQLAKDKNVSIVLNQYVNDIQAILYADSRVIDLTDDIITCMNQETVNLHLPDIAATLPKEQEEKAAS